MSNASPRFATKAEVVQDFRIQTIQEATARVVARAGLEGASMQAIAEEAGIAKGTIYLYFKDRADLLERTAAATLDDLLEEVEEVFDSAESFPEQLRALVERLLRFFGQRRHFFRLYLAVRYPEGDPDEMRQKRPKTPHYQRYLQRLAHFLAQAMERGEVRRLEPERLALFLSEGINAILLQRIQSGDGPPPTEEAQWMTEILLHGMLQKDKS